MREHDNPFWEMKEGRVEKLHENIKIVSNYIPEYSVDALFGKGSEEGCEYCK